MSQPNPEHKSQKQDNLVKGNTVGGDLIFAPQQIDTYIETQIVEISVDKITQQPLIKTSPYKGLKRFNLGDREYFFGRDALIAKLFNAVNKSNFSLVLGASGSGKSSVVRAGLVPELKKSLESQEFYDFIFTPNQDPFESLYRCLLSEEKDYRFSKSDVEFVREGRPNTLPQLISKLKKDEERWFIFIDQFEQLFINVDIEKRNNFIQGIVQVAKKGDSSVRIVLAMRSDFLEQFSFYPTLGAIANKNNIHLVTEMYPDELRQAIEQPAAKNGVVFEKGLVEQIIKEVEGQKGYLPLLQYTLDLLWEKECTTKAADGGFHIEDRTLNKITYVALGGVRGALQKRVNEIYTDICEKKEDGELVTKQIFLKLVNIIDSDSGSRAVSRRAYRDEFVDKPIENTLKRFINENLLVSSYEYSSEEKLSVETTTKSIQYATIEIAHEILISSWDKLKRWLEEEKEAIILKNWLAGETRRWLEVRAKDDKKASDELLKGSRLHQIVEFRDKNAFKKLGSLTEKEEEFIDASVKWRKFVQTEEERVQKEKTRLQQRAIKWLSGGLAAAFIATVNAVWQWQRIQRQTKLAELERDIFSIDGLLKREPTQALLKAIISMGKSKAKFPQLIHDAESSLLNAIQNSRETNILRGHKDSVKDIAVSPDDEKIISAGNDGTVRIWDLKNKRSKLIDDYKGIPVDSVSFDKSGKIIASVSQKGDVRIRNLEKKLFCSYKLPTKKERVNSHRGVNIEFNPKNNELILGSSNGFLTSWKLNLDKCEKQSVLLYKNRYPISAIKIISNGKNVAFGDTAYSLKLVDIFNLDLPATILLPEEAGFLSTIENIDFKDNFALAYGSYENHILSNKIKKKKSQDNYPNSNGKSSILLAQASSITFRPNSLDRFEYLSTYNQLVLGTPDLGDGNNLFLKSTDSDLEIFDFSFIGHQGWVSSVSFNSDGNTLISGGSDGTIRLWDSDSLYPSLIASIVEEVKLFDYQGNQLNIGWQESEYGEGKHLQLTTDNSDIYRSDYAVFNPRKNRIFYSSDRKYTAHLSPDNLIKISNTSNKKKEKIFTIKGQVGFIAISGQSQKIVILKNNHIEIRNFSGKLISNFSYPNSIIDMSFDSEKVTYAVEKILDISPDGNKIAIVETGIYNVGNNSSLQILDIQGKQINKFPNVTFAELIRFSIDGKYILTFPNKYSNFDIYPIHWQPLLKIACHRLENHPALNQSEASVYCKKK